MTRISLIRRNGIAFSLLELLIVVALISVLLVGVVPVVNSLSKSSGRKSVISLVTSTLEQARAQAIKDGRPTYVAFAGQPVDGTTGISDKTILDRYFYRSVAIFEEDAADPTKPKVQIAPWKVFATGISLRTEISSSKANNAAWVSNKFSFTPFGSQMQDFPFIKFSPTGAIELPSPSSTAATTTGPLALRLFEGSVNGITEKPTNSANKDETISIARLTGRAEYVP